VAHQERLAFWRPEAEDRLTAIDQMPGIQIQSMLLDEVWGCLSSRQA
jgi:hypothetical protein